MIAVSFILRNQIMIGMLGTLFLFVLLRKRRKFFCLRIICSVLAAISLSAFVPIPAPFSYLVYFVAINLIVWICFDYSWKHVLFSATCAYCVQHMTSKIAYLLMTLWGHFDFVFVRYNYSLLSLAMLLLVNAAVCIPIYFIWTRRVIRGGELKLGSFKTLIYTAVFIVCAVFLSFYTELALVEGGSPLFELGYICLNGLCALFAWIVLMVNFANCRGELLTEEKRTLEQLLEKDKQQYELAKQNMERINIRYHDIKKRRGMAMTVEEAQKFDEELKKFRKLYYTGNEVVDITLSEKASLCADAGIQFICSVDGSRLDMIKPYQIYSLLGNAIDNAIEAVSRLPAGNRAIGLQIKTHGSFVSVIVYNGYEGDLEFKGGLPQTTKGDRSNHGYGMKSIRHIVDKYDGRMLINGDGGVFRLTMLFQSNGSRAPSAI